MVSFKKLGFSFFTSSNIFRPSSGELSITPVSIGLKYPTFKPFFAKYFKKTSLANVLPTFVFVAVINIAFPI